MEQTNGWKVVEIHFKGNQYQGFYKVTKKGEITVEVKKDIGCLPGDSITIGVDNLVVQKVYINNRCAEITCIEEKTELKKSLFTKKKLKKALGDENEQI